MKENSTHARARAKKNPLFCTTISTRVLLVPFVSCFARLRKCAHFLIKNSCQCSFLTFKEEAKTFFFKNKIAIFLVRRHKKRSRNTFYSITNETKRIELAQEEEEEGEEGDISFFALDIEKALHSSLYWIRFRACSRREGEDGTFLKSREH